MQRGLNAAKVSSCPLQMSPVGITIWADGNNEMFLYLKGRRCPRKVAWLLASQCLSRCDAHPTDRLQVCLCGRGISTRVRTLKTMQ